MIDYSAIREHIENLLDENIEGIVVKYENVFLKDEAAEHVSVVDTDINSVTVAMGSSNRLVTGALIFQIFTGIGTGTRKAREVAADICTLLLDTGIEGVNFTGDAELVSVGETEDRRFYQHNLTTPYQYEYGNITGD